MQEIKILSSQSYNNFENEWYHKLVNKDHFWWKARFSILLKQLKTINLDPTQSLKGLEIGCGNGLLICELEKRTSWIIDGADLDLELLKSMKSKKGEKFLYDIRECKLFLKEKYDFIILFDVLEHIKDQDDFLYAVLFHLKKKGEIFINVPALSFLWSSYDELQNHFRRYCKLDFNNLFYKKNIKTINMEYWGISFIPLLFLRKIILKFQKKTPSVLKNGFKPPHKILNKFLYILFTLELLIFKKVPLGSSLFYMGQKNE